MWFWRTAVAAFVRVVPSGRVALYVQSRLLCGASTYGKVTPQATLALIPPVITSLTLLIVAGIGVALATRMVPVAAHPESVEPVLLTFTEYADVPDSPVNSCQLAGVTVLSIVQL